MRRGGAWAIPVFTAALIMGVPISGTAGLELATPLREAVMLLGWSGEDQPRIELATSRPPDGSSTAAAWVRIPDDGCAVPIIYVATDHYVYRDAANGDYQALVELAGILAHERWHLRHGRDEVGAYTAQLSVMEYLHANSLHLFAVRRALRRVQKEMRKSLPAR
jgi:hypothetical protein